jgi:enoyl-CoA hydratase/carnithine racemase
MGDGPVRTTVADGVRTITLASPANRNALSRALVAGLRDALVEAGADDDTQVVVLRAEGPAFCAGADLREAAEADADAQADTSRSLLALFRAIVALPVPVVARVHAPVRAGGIGIVAACDLAIAATSATFALTEVRLGLAPAIISTVVVPRLGDRSASRLLLTGETFDGTHAAAVGLVTAAVAGDRLDAAVDEIVGYLRVSPRQGLVETKRLLADPLVARIDGDGPAMTALSSRLFQSHVARERFASFLDRR